MQFYRWKFHVACFITLCPFAAAGCADATNVPSPVAAEGAPAANGAVPNGSAAESASAAANAAVAPQGPPATAAEVAKLLDLSTLPLFAGSEPLPRRSVVSLSYNAPGKTTQVFEFHRRQLTDRKWRELPGGVAADTSANAEFARDGFSLSLMVYPSGMDGKSNVSLTHHGNVDLAGLPLPPGAKTLFIGPASAMFDAEEPAVATAETCKKLLMEKGWQPYGVAGDTQSFKQNGVRLMATVGAAPAQQGKTIVTFISDMMSVDLPAPLDTIDLQYSDQTARLMFDTKATEAEIEAFYRQTLATAGWKPTLDKTIKLDFKDTLIFRNPQKDMLQLEMYDVAEKNRVLLSFLSATEIADMDKKMNAQAEKFKAEKNKPLPKVTIALPPGAKDVEQRKNRLEFKVATGSAPEVVETWRKRFAQDGWKEEVATLENAAGAITFKKGELDVSVIYSDTGILPADFTVHASGAEIEQAAERE